MSHAVYLFLVDASDTEEDWDGWKGRVDDFVTEHGDSNNWYTALMGVTQKDGVHVYADSTHFSAASPGGTPTWEKALRLSLGMVQADLRLRGSRSMTVPGMAANSAEVELEALSREELLGVILKEVPASLAWQLMQMSVQDFETLREMDTDYSRIGDLNGLYTFKKTFEIYTSLIASAVPPFYGGENVCFYTHRCFDLRIDRGTDLTGCAILYADIHT